MICFSYNNKIILNKFLHKPRVYGSSGSTNLSGLKFFIDFKWYLKFFIDFKWYLLSSINLNICWFWVLSSFRKKGVWTEEFSVSCTVREYNNYIHTKLVDYNKCYFSHSYINMYTVYKNLREVREHTENYGIK